MFVRCPLSSTGWVGGKRAAGATRGRFILTKRGKPWERGWGLPYVRSVRKVYIMWNTLLNTDTTKQTNMYLTRQVEICRMLMVFCWLCK
jgi:hypothetical protein